jgi:hypothetical protein
MANPNNVASQETKDTKSNQEVTEDNNKEDNKKVTEENNDKVIEDVNNQKITEPTFQDKVSTTIKEVTRDENGKLKFPKDTPTEVVFAATAELRRRDTQAEYTKARQKQVVLEAEKQELLKQASSNATIELTEEQIEELDDMKFSDPDGWRQKMNAYEQKARNEHSEKINKQLEEVSAKGTKMAELERRKQVLKEFLSVNPGLVINDDIINNDIPPRITKKLEDGVVTFEEFLSNVSDYIKAGKTIATEDDITNQPNLSKAGGGDTPSEDAINNQSMKTYQTEVY